MAYRARDTQDDVMLELLCAVRAGRPAPARELLPVDDPHDSAVWQRWREDLDADLRRTLRAKHIAFRDEPSLGDRDTLCVQLADGTRHSVCI